MSLLIARDILNFTSTERKWGTMFFRRLSVISDLKITIAPIISGNYLKTGENTIGLWTGRGWYSLGLPGVIHKSPVFRIQAHFTSNHSSTVIVSDTTWRTSNSNISQIGNWRWNDMGGELVDSRISMNELENR